MLAAYLLNIQILRVGYKDMVPVTIKTFKGLDITSDGIFYAMTDLKTFILVHPDNVTKIPRVERLRAIITDEQAVNLSVGNITDVIEIFNTEETVDEICPKG